MRPQQGITEQDKYDAIDRLGDMMGTDGAGTTDGGLVDGIDSYIDYVGLGGEFRIKVFNQPHLIEYMNELSDGEDVLVRILNSTGDSHWLVGRLRCSERKRHARRPHRRHLAH